jgi:putative transposase
MSGSGRARGCDSPALLNYLHAYESVSDARAGLSRYFQFYNQRRPHRGLEGRTPDECYFGAPAAVAAAA